MRQVSIAVLGTLLTAASPTPAEVFHSRESALRLAFPGADRIESRDLLLTREEASRVEELAGVALESRMVSVYEGIRGSERLGWAFLDTHTVRTLPETFLLVLAPDGTVRAAHLLAFHEPPEYRPPGRWLERFAGKRLDADLAVGRGVDAISGSTLSAYALTAGVRRLTAVWRVKLAASDDWREAATE